MSQCIFQLSNILFICVFFFLYFYSFFPLSLSSDPGERATRPHLQEWIKRSVHLHCKAPGGGFEKWRQVPKPRGHVHVEGVSRPERIRLRAFHRVRNFFAFDNSLHPGFNPNWHLSFIFNPKEGLLFVDLDHCKCSKRLYLLPGTRTDGIAWGWLSTDACCTRGTLSGTAAPSPRWSQTSSGGSTSSVSAAPLEMWWATWTTSSIGFPSKVRQI